MKETMLTIPDIVSFCLNDKIPFIKGKNNNAINPIAAPAPCIFDAVVTASLLSFTLNSPESNPAPTAKIPIERSSKIDKIGKFAFVFQKKTKAENVKKQDVKSSKTKEAIISTQDVEGKENIEKAHIMEAIQYRSLDKKYTV